MDKEVVGTD